MQVINGEMFSKENIKLKLIDLIKAIPENDWNWYLYEIDAIGCALYGLSMPDFEDLVLSKKHGLEMSWSEVKLLANSLDDIKTFFIVASSGLLLYEDVDIDNLTNCLAIINVFDSTFWEVKIK
ncbi:hypothetical protein Bresa_02334|uniref:Uncharacterized protein n=2 Tax=Brenneria TaxID=71655 RepID=A0A366I3I8_9GAMM|nr:MULTISPECIES: hypothetical protein [Brenneria]MCL2891255.1 hypothetical protein [Brenneria tiliae]NMN92075.1 hypothetical protein [Brenneria salicis ATCC 15712 = DSM 30166]RBP61174.1 hypothetical protein DES54_12631 [Brenneria salicis ATCC 15712 = DSM 30166]RLM30197.1 hypothetical protein BHG07_12110 [Brenneria salicis ATCC 15712 = DSM 30166]